MGPPWRAKESRPYRGGGLSGRGSFSYRRRGGGLNTFNQSDIRSPSPALGTLLERVSKRDLEDLVAEHGRTAEQLYISECELAGSYNWMKASGTIMVPGKPPSWSPSSGSQQLRQDGSNGERYCKDKNASRWPAHPMEPAVRTVLTQNKDLKSQSIDLFACSSTLGSLLRFVQGIEKPIRFLVEVVGNTVFFIRRENSPTETIDGLKGNGHTFLEAYTTWDQDVASSATHQRLVKYRLANLTFCVRFEGDTFIPSTHIPTSKVPNSQSHKSDDLSEALGNFGIATTINKAEQSDSLTILRGGDVISQDAIVDIKTRTIWKKEAGNTLEEELPRYWATQMKNFCLAYHSRGLFEENDITVRRIENEVLEWEADNQDVIRRFKVLVDKIIETVKAQPDGKLEVRSKSIDMIELREHEIDSHEVLPSEWRARWLGDPDPSTNDRRDESSASEGK